MLFRSNEGDAEAALKKAAKRVKAGYYVPHLAHATMEPPSAVARIVNGQCEVWTSVQSPQAARERIAKRLNLGMDKVKKAKPDGRTLLVIPAGNLTINPTLMPKTAGYVPEDLAAIGMFARSPMILVVAPTLGVKSVAELIALAKAQGGKLTYSSAGPASNPHLASELFKALAGVDLEQIGRAHV